MTSEMPLRLSLAVQLRGIGALLRREIITRYGRYNIGFMWLFVEPMMFTTGVTALWSFTKATHGSRLPIVAFAVTGYSTVLLWRNATTRCAKAIEPNLGLLYHRNVRVIDLMAARLVLEIAGATISLLTLMLFYILVEWIEPPVDILTMINAWLLLSWFAVSLGLIVGAISELSDVFDRIWHVMTYLFFPLSGAVYMVDWLPKAAQRYALWVPTVHGIEMLRYGYFGDAVRPHYNPKYLLIINLVLMLIGLALVSETGRRVEPQ